MKTKRIGLCVIAVFLIVVLIYSGIQKKHTVTLLNNDEDRIKTEQIQPLWEIVKVSGDRDTDVVFTDVETSNKWYKVEGGGNLTLCPVNVRIE